MTTGARFLESARDEFRIYKRMADKAAAQVDDAGFFRAPDAEGNSIAVIMRHLAGNMRSRWVDFLTTDGEKPDRHRDGEFELPDTAGRDDVLNDWESGWSAVFAALDPLTDDDLAGTVTIRGVPMPVPGAIQRQLAHYAYHVGQIVLLARHWVGPAWQTLSIPRGASEEWNKARWGKGREAGAAGARGV